jgi:hypothetical protein
VTSALEGGGWSAPCPGRFTPGKDPVPIVPGFIPGGGPQGWSGLVRKISPPPGFDPRTVQPVAIRYTDWAIPARDLVQLPTQYSSSAIGNKSYIYSILHSLGLYSLSKFRIQHYDLLQGWRNVLRSHAQFVNKFQRNLSHTHGNFGEQNTILELSIIIIDYCTIIIIIIIIIKACCDKFTAELYYIILYL